MEITEVLRKGIVTEQSVKLQENYNKYTFEVALKANKIDVRRAVETLFKVEVLSVNIMRMPGKPKMMHRKGAPPQPIQPREWKKAIVTLKNGQTIDALKA